MFNGRDLLTCSYDGLVSAEASDVLTCFSLARKSNLDVTLYLETLVLTGLLKVFCVVRV